jgi:hypothetical protein
VQTRAIRRRCDFIATCLCEIVRRALEEGFGIYDRHFGESGTTTYVSP